MIVAEAADSAAFLRRRASVDFSPNAANRIGRKVAVSLLFRTVSLVFGSL